MNQSIEHIALLIDADNSPASKIDVILAELATHGVVNIRRAYGNWKSRRLKGWEDVLHEYAIQPIQQFDYTKGKNATDMAMLIDGMDLLYAKNLDAFCLVSSDSDFTPLVMRILADGRRVYGFGQKTTPDPFVNACSRFLYLENLGREEAEAPSKSPETKKKSGRELKGDAQLINLLRNAVESAEDEDGWSNLAHVGSYISNRASFDPRNYGYTRLGELFKTIDLFDTEMRGKNVMYIRDKKKAKQSAAVKDAR